MKYSIIIAALLGLMTSEEVNAITRYTPHNSYVQEEANDSSDSDSDDED